MLTRTIRNSPRTSPGRDDAAGQRAHEIDRRPDSLDRLRRPFDEAIDRWTNEGGALGANGRSGHSKAGHFIVTIQAQADRVDELVKVDSQNGARRLVHFG